MKSKKGLSLMLFEMGLYTYLEKNHSLLLKIKIFILLLIRKKT